MEKVTLEDGQSADIVAGNIEKLMELFPDAIKEGAVDFEVLRQLLGDASVLNEDDEKYGLSWHGKKAARQIALTPSTGTLLPREDQSVDWDTTQNLAIAGDNLEALKLLQKPYANKIKVIYIDPPWHKELEPETDTHVFFRDSAFEDDIAKTNMAAILEQNGITHVRSL